MIRINLLPRAPRRRLPLRPFLEVAVPIATLVVALVVSFTLAGQTRRLESDLAETKKQIDEIRPTVERVLELDRQIAVLRRKEEVVADLLKQQLPAAAILTEVRSLIPRDVWTISLNVPEPSMLNVEGVAVSYYAVARFMDNLELGELFRRVDLTVAQTEKIGPTDVVRFQITARILKAQASGGGVRQ